ncbi:RagB/SusD family nutrient uptake outer membrane protein [Pedobacter alpinus]|uniref:RagB/SusD family nutrient uptake outer membrane protein n=1 Tax=Pedobacter alpinus TaxID=1590643 RepID=A0ABW5TQ20_9SPHI
MKKLAHLIFLSILLASCKDYLDAKPDKQLAVPATLQDMNALLDNAFMNTYTLLGEVSADNFYHTEAIWNSIPAERDRKIYTWENDAADGDTGAWSGRYNIIFVANVVLDGIEKISPKPNEQEEWKRIKGAALFFRAYALTETAQLFTAPYDDADADIALGIPIKLSPDINENISRGNLSDTYDRILTDFKQAATLLPSSSIIATRPNRAAAFGALARVYLYQRDYPKAGLYADSALQISNELLDYNDINSRVATPFFRFNTEVVFHAYSSSSNLTLSRCRVDSMLYESYDERDLRKVLFFLQNSDKKSYAFKGTYDGNNNNHFNGITTAELYLIRAEAMARADKKEEALADLNTLMANRWEDGFFTAITANTSEEALSKILAERRKELVFRGQRWNDLRRLNKEPAFAETLTRQLGSKTFTLPPNDKRYVFPIPEDIIQISGMPQNER